MTLFEYVYKLNMILKKNPEYENLIVVYAADDEGNRFFEVEKTPTLGNYDGEREITEEFIDETALEFGEKINAICIN